MGSKPELSSEPTKDKGGELAISTAIALRLDLRKQRLGGASVLLASVRISLEGLLDRGVIRSQLALRLVSLVLRRCCFFRLSQPRANRVAR